MRFIGARGNAPAALVAAAPAAVAAAGRAVADNMNPINFRGYVYGSKEVRAALTSLQHGKCAFCEVKILPVATAHVEHFRPKAAVINELTGALMKPGYYWLAYSWENLTLSCPSCNSQAHKGNRFPLTNEANRASGPDTDLALEAPMLIDPFAEDPRPLIGFRQGVAYAVGGNPRADATIKVLGLNREDLVDAREDQIKLILRMAAALAEMGPSPARDDLEIQLADMISERGSFHTCLQAVLS